MTKKTKANLHKDSPVKAVPPPPPAANGNGEDQIPSLPQTPQPQQQGNQRQVYAIDPMLHNRIVKALRKAPVEVVEELLMELNPKNLMTATLTDKPPENGPGK